MSSELQQASVATTGVGHRGAVDALWLAFSSPRTAGWLLVAAGTIDLLLPGRAGALEAALRGTAALAFFALVAAALRLVAGRARPDAAMRAALADAGLRRVSFVPFFRRELTAASAARLDAIGTRANVAPLAGWLLAVALAMPLAVAAAATFWTEIGTVRVMTDADSEFVRLEAPAPGAQRNLGARVRLDASALVRGEPALPGLRVRSAGGQGSSEVPLAQGELADAAGYHWSPQMLVPVERIGAAELLAVPRAGGEGVRVTVRQGPGVTLPDGTILRLADGHPSYAGQLGPAVRIEEVGAGGELVRDEWVYSRTPDFDAVHGSGAWSLSLVGFALNHAVELRAVQGTAASGQLVPIWLGALVLLGVVSVLLAQPRIHVAGRDGDWQLVELGASPGPGTASAVREQLLGPEHEATVRDIERSLGEAAG